MNGLFSLNEFNTFTRELTLYNENIDTECILEFYCYVKDLK